MPGLVTFYDIRPGNGAGLFIQPQSPHGAMYIHRHSRHIKHQVSSDFKWDTEISIVNVRY